jgi:hypothetical protein
MELMPEVADKRVILIQKIAKKNLLAAKKIYAVLGKGSAHNDNRQDCRQRV